MDVDFLLDIADRDKADIEKALLKYAIESLRKQIKYYEALIQSEARDEFNGVNTSRRKTIKEINTLIDKLT